MSNIKYNLTIITRNMCLVIMKSSTCSFGQSGFDSNYKFKTATSVAHNPKSSRLDLGEFGRTVQRGVTMVIYVTSKPVKIVPQFTHG